MWVLISCARVVKDVSDLIRASCFSITRIYGAKRGNHGQYSITRMFFFALGILRTML